MKVGIIGGLMFGGLIAMVLLGLVPGLILIGIGTVAASWELVKERRAATNYNVNYPAYRY